MIVPFPAGGPADAIARILGERMRVSLGQPVIVENVSGAGGSIGVGRVARAAPDGYTLSIGQLNSHVFSGAVYSAPYDLLTDLRSGRFADNEPADDRGKEGFAGKAIMKELIAWLKANPDKASFATPGVGSPSHVWGSLLPKQYRHSLPVRALSRRRARAAGRVVSGQIDLTCLQASDLLPQVRSGNIRAYAILANDSLGARHRHSDCR